MVCALGSAAMNYGAADVSSLRSVAAYVMPPVFLAIVTDRVIAVVRRHMLGMEAERSAWAVIGRAALAVLTGAGKAVLYGLRLALAPGSTLSGARTLVLLATPLPGPRALAQEHAQVDAARAALGTVRAAIGEDLRELRDRHELTAAHAGDTLRAAQEAVPHGNPGAYGTRSVQRPRPYGSTLRTEAETTGGRPAEGPGAVRAAIGGDLRELRDRQEAAAREPERGPLARAGRSSVRRSRAYGTRSVRRPGRTGNAPHGASRPYGSSRAAEDSRPRSTATRSWPSSPARSATRSAAGTGGHRTTTS